MTATFGGGVRAWVWFGEAREVPPKTRSRLVGGSDVGVHDAGAALMSWTANLLPVDI